MERDEPEVRFREREQRLVDVPCDSTDSRSRSKPWASEIEIDRLLKLCSKPLEPETEKALVECAMSGDARAKEMLWKNNLKTIVRLAKPTESITRADLVAVGIEALFKALETFDARRSVRFSTYAFPFIKFSMQRSVENQASMIRLPEYRRELVRRLGRSIQLHFNLYGVAPRVDELAKEHGVSESEVMITLEAEYHSDVVLFDPVLEDPGVSDSTDSQPESVAQQRELEQLVAKVLKSLSDRERYVLLMRFPLDGSEQRTLEEIGRVLGVTRERVRQIESAALKTLRLKYSKLITVFLDVQPERSSVEGCSWKDDLFTECLLHLQRSHGQAACAELTAVLRNAFELRRNQFVLEKTDADIEPDEIVYFVIEHLLAKGLVRSIFGGSEFVLTAAGIAWLECKARNLNATTFLARLIRRVATTGGGRELA